MTNEQLAAYIEQLTMNLGRLLSDAQNKLNEIGIEHEIECKLLPISTPQEVLNWRISSPQYENVETLNITAMQPLFWFVENLRQTILMLDPKRNENDKH